jgi:predicted nucleic acid-binding protein
MPAVSNSSPLIFYAVVGRLELLHETYGEILVPPAVWREAGATSGDRPGADVIRRAAWIRRRSPSDKELSLPSLVSLDAGEAEAIAMALPIWPRIPVLLDDLIARRTAARLGLAVTGSAGVLIQAKRLGLIAKVHPILDELRGAGLYLSESADSQALDLANEP